MVVMPPPPGAPGMLREIGRLLSLPGTLLLLAVTTLGTGHHQRGPIERVHSNLQNRDRGLIHEATGME
jgi:hypothetical protein